MKKLIIASALGASTILLAACADSTNEDAVAEDTTIVEDTALDTDAMPADADWPAGTRIVEEGGVTYRVNSDGTRVEIADGEWSIVTEGETRYRVGSNGVRYEIDEDGIDVDDNEPDGIDVDVGTNSQGNLDVDVSTDGEDASPGEDEN